MKNSKTILAILAGLGLATFATVTTAAIEHFYIENHTDHSYKITALSNSGDQNCTEVVTNNATLPARAHMDVNVNVIGSPSVRCTFENSYRNFMITDETDPTNSLKVQYLHPLHGSNVVFQAGPSTVKFTANGTWLKILG